MARDSPTRANVSGRRVGIILLVSRYRTRAVHDRSGSRYILNNSLRAASMIIATASWLIRRSIEIAKNCSTIELICPTIFRLCSACS
jgi:hypothetical protein